MPSRSYSTTKNSCSGIRKLAAPAVTVMTRQQARHARERAQRNPDACLRIETSKHDERDRYVAILLEEVKKAFSARKTSPDRPLFSERGRLYMDAKALEASAGCEEEPPMEEQLQKAIGKSRARSRRPVKAGSKGIVIINIKRLQVMV